MNTRTLKTLLVWLSLSSTLLAQQPEGLDTDWPRAARPDWNQTALETLLEYSGEQTSTGVVIVQGGELIVERYWPVPLSRRFARMVDGTTDDGRSLEDVASAQKNIVSFLVGKAVGQQLVGIEETVTSILGEGWSATDKVNEARITIRHLLTMTSGLTPQLRSEAEPGTKWRYNTRAYSQLLPVLEAVSETDITSLTEQWLLRPVGMSESSWQPREWLQNQDANSLGFVTSARDLARFGQLMLSEGTWGDQQVLRHEGYLDDSVRPSLQLNPGYGYLWWVNGVPVTRAGGQASPSLVPAAPSDLYAGLGALGRKLYVVPSLDLVVTRLGDQPKDRDFDQQFWLRLMAVLPQEATCGACAPPLADELSQAKTPQGETISWREHIIDDPTRGVADLSGSDGLAMADLDGDGFEDIVSVHESDTVYDGRPIGHVRIAYGSKDPNQWHLATLASGVEAAAAEDVSLMDVNGDGHIDVLVACELAHLIYFQNPGKNARTAHWQRVIPEITRDRGSFIRAFLADLDGDGRPEVSAANKGEQNPAATADPPKRNISIYRIPADPLAGDQWVEQVLGQVQVPINAEPVDLDGDGDLDIVAGSRRERRVLWFENLGKLEFREHSINISGAPNDLSITGFNMDYADLNGDGRTDIVSTAWPGSILLLTQPERFDEPWQFSLIGTTPPDQLVSVRLVDIDGDGDLDAFSGGYSRGPRDQDGPLVTVNDPMGRIVWFENRGDTWVTHNVSRPKRGMYDKWLFRDLDGDGDLDALGTRGNSAPFDGVIWLEQVRSAEPRPAFEAARAIDSQQMGPPER